jgi:acyl carrier protein
MAYKSSDAASPGGTETARVVADLWAELFQIEQAGAEDHFLDLGGDSLLGKRLLAGIESRLGFKIPFRTLLDAPTLGEFTTRVEEIARSKALSGIAEP